MPHTKTTLKCKRCGEHIYSDEGFVSKAKGYYHYHTCKKPLKPWQCKKFKPTHEVEKHTFVIPNKMRGFRMSRDYD